MMSVDDRQKLIKSLCFKIKLDSFRLGLIVSLFTNNFYYNHPQLEPDQYKQICGQI